MSKKTIAALITGTLLMMLLSRLLAGGDLSARQIMERVDNRYTGNDQVADMTMTLIKSGGRKRVRKVKVWRKKYGDDEKSLMRFLEPADVRGTGFLTWEHKGKNDEQWLYLPALMKVKRISSGEKGKSFMGTDFSYEDLGSYNIDDYKYTLLKSEIFDGKDCWVIESVPGPGKKKSYGKMVLWVRKDIFIVVRVDFYDKRGNFLKRLHSTDIEEIDGIQTVMKMEMENMQKKQKTVLKFENVRYNVGLDDEIFTERNLTKE